MRAALLLAAALAAASPPGARGATAVLRALRVDNRCALPVILHEAGQRSIAPGEVVTFTSGVDMAGARLSLSYESTYISENLAILEMNGMFSKIGEVGSKQNINFVAQWGFIDLAMDVALWADAARTRLACQDGRARCTYAPRDCEGVADGSARFEQRGPPGSTYGFCRATRGLGDPGGCVGGYAAYMNDHCELFDRDSGHWTTQARSVGFRGMGWTEARFADGSVAQSTLTGREEDGPAVTYECWEEPCISQKTQCAALGQTSVGNVGFAINCDEVAGVVDVAVLEILACSSITSTPTTTAAPSSSTDAPTATSSPAPTTAPASSSSILPPQPEPSSPTPTTPPASSTSTAPSQSAPSLPTLAPNDCDEKNWPDLDHGLTCGPCKVLVNRFSSQYKTCNGYCKSINRKCVGAWEEVNENCDVLFIMACDQTIASNDAICECGDKAPPSASTTAPPTVAPTAMPPVNLRGNGGVGAAGALLRNLYGLCLGSAQRNATSGVVQLQTCAPFDRDQRWQYDYVAGQIKTSDEICFEAQETNGSSVQLRACNLSNTNQQWEYDANTAQIKARRGDCLEALQRSVSGGLLRLSSCDVWNRSQRWSLGDALLIKAVDGKCLDAPKRGTDGGKVHMWDCNRWNRNQQWAYDASAGQIKNLQGRCLEAQQGLQNGGKVYVSDCNATSKNQQWDCEAASGLVRSRQGLCLDAAEASTKGGLVRTWECLRGNRRQLWSFNAITPASLMAAKPHAALAAITDAGGGGRCSFPGLQPGMPHYWDAGCTAEALGCNADGVSVECRFCGTWIFRSIECPGARAPFRLEF